VLPNGFLFCNGLPCVLTSISCVQGFLLLVLHTHTHTHTGMQTKYYRRVSLIMNIIVTVKCGKKIVKLISKN